ncbi:MAG: RNA polymerase sigma factor, partial [Pseudonocardiaceae bacterium]
TVASFRLQPADAEDAVQSTWLRVLERIDTLRDPECLGSWLATTASRECLALLRRRNREVPDDLAGTQLVSTEEGPDAAVVTREIHQAVNTAVGELSERRQTLTQLLFYQPEHSYAEVSHATGMPQGSIGPTAYGFCGSYATRWSSVVSVRYRSSALATTKLNLLNHCGRARL